MRLEKILACCLLLFTFTMTSCTVSKVVGEQNESEKRASDAVDKKAGKKADDKKDKKDDDKAFSDIITDEAVTDEGLFDVHVVDDKHYYSIPDSMMDVEMLLVTRIAKTADNIGYGGEKSNTQVVRWEMQGKKKLLLRRVSYENVADEDQPIYQAVRNSNFEPILKAFEVKSPNKDSTGVLIEVTDLFTSDIPSLGLAKFQRERFKVRRLDKTRTFISSAKSFPENIEVKHVLTYEAGSPPSNSSSGVISLEMNQSMILLPAVPMQPRKADKRVGFFSVSMTDYGRDAQKAEVRNYITRWRLEPKDPEAWARGELVEPIKPIVYYIDPATPMKWRPYLKQGVDDWKVAFEEAGFKNAIMAKDPPSMEEDPEFSPEDIRYSVIRYFSSDVQNAYGPHVHDPRSGEILESDIGWFHNVMNLLRNWYFVQTAAVNPEARSVKFSDAEMGELIRFVSAHEVGHTIGLPHNWGSSYAIPVDSLRSPTYTSAHGTAPSIMDYARFNYIAQPGDGVTRFFPMIGAYDLWSVKWGYSPIPEARNADEETPILNEWVKEKAGDPRFFYGRASGAKVDPRSQNEDLGDNAVLASTYGLANLKVITENLLSWTSDDAKDYSDLNEIYGNVLTQWNRYMGHVSANIGGITENYKTFDQDGVVYSHVPKATQKEAMLFLSDHGLDGTEWMLNKDILNRVQHAGIVDRIRRYQVGIVKNLLDPQRIARLMEADALEGEDHYSAGDLFGDVRYSVWKELRGTTEIDPFRRNLQRGYLEQMETLMTKELLSDVPPQFRSFLAVTPISVSQSDIRAYVRADLKRLQSQVAAASRRGSDMRKMHLTDALARINDILDPKN